MKNSYFFRFNLTEISFISEFVEDKINQRYGFTIIFKAGNIRNLYLEGNWFKLKPQVEELKKKYNELIELIESKAKEA